MDNYPRWVLSQKVINPKTTQENVPKLIKTLKNISYDVVALTSRQPSVAQETLNQLDQLSLDFSKVKTSYTYQSENPAMYENGVVFAHDLNQKGDIFKQWFSDYQSELSDPKSIKNIIFVDDSKRHVLDMAEAVSELGINYIGIHFTGYQKENFSCKVATNEESLVLKSQME